MAVDFVTRVSWPRNSARQKKAGFQIKVPKGLADEQVRAPVYASVSEITNVLKSGSNLSTSTGASLGSVKGLVTADLELKFENTQAQWRSQPAGGPNSTTGPVNFSFLGGKVFIDLSLSIYILEQMKPQVGNPASAKIFSILYSHELLHVFDYLDMLNNWLTPKLRQEMFVKNYLIDGKQWTVGKGSDPTGKTIAEFEKDARSRLESDAFYLWDTERNRRKEIRDSPAEYAKVWDKVSDIMSAP